jgi:hypothetical protein
VFLTAKKYNILNAVHRTFGNNDCAPVEKISLTPLVYADSSSREGLIYFVDMAVCTPLEAILITLHINLVSAFIQPFSFVYEDDGG